MKHLGIITTFIVLAITVQASQANPWHVRKGGTLLDGTETTTSVAGALKLEDNGWSASTAKIGLKCSEGAPEMYVLSDTNFVKIDPRGSSTPIKIGFKADNEIVSFDAIVPHPSILPTYALFQDRLALLEFLRKYDGGSAQVQFPVARTGIPEVRNLSLEKVIETTDKLLATCGPLKTWELEEEPVVSDISAEKTTEDTNDTLLDLSTQLQLRIIFKVIEKMVETGKVTPEEVAQSLATLAETKSD
jgi:hypothetical protein